VTAYTDAGGAVYKGLALADNGTANFLYATDFHNNKIDVLDTTFTKQTPTAATFRLHRPDTAGWLRPIRDPGDQEWSGRRSPAVCDLCANSRVRTTHDHTSGAGLGLVDVFDANGNFVSHLIPVGGALNAPWGVALAPADFGTLSNALLVGNFGDGKINAFDPTTGRFIGTVQNSTRAAFAEPASMGIAFGNDAANQARQHSVLRRCDQQPANGS